MSDDPVIPLPPGRGVDIPARFIRQAYEHLQHTRERYITFIFAGELVADAVCYGISTQAPSVRLIEQRPTLDEPPLWTIQTITPNVVIDVIKREGPINTKKICDTLGIVRGDTSLRQRVRRVLESLALMHAIRKVGDKRQPDFVVFRARTQTETSGISRKDITDEMVIEQLRQHGPLASRTIGDNLGLDRKNNLVRGKITEIVGRLIREGRVQHIEGNVGMGRVYELIEEEQDQATA